MRFKAPFYRFLVTLAGFSLPLVIFAALLPSLINAEPVKKRLIEELKSWAGSHVEINGPVEIGNIFSLSLSAKNVEFFAFQGIPSLKTLKAEEITARIEWVDLLYGELDFDKIKIRNATAHLGHVEQQEMLAVAQAVMAIPRKAQFAAFILDDCQIVIDSEAGQPPQRANLENLIVTLSSASQKIELKARVKFDEERLSISASTQGEKDRESGLMPLSIQIESERLTAAFDGEAKIAADWHAIGSLSLNTANPAQLGKLLGDMQLTDFNAPLHLSGNADISRSRLRLEGGQISIAGQEGTGELDLNLENRQPRLEGSMAFQALDVEGIVSALANRDLVTGTNAEMLRETLLNSQIDLRISAENIAWRDLNFANTAFTLLGKHGNFSTELAHTELFDGSVLGHAGLDLTGAIPSAQARITGRNLDIGKLQSLGNNGSWITGQTNGSFDVTTVGRSAAQMLENARVTGKAYLPDGGQLRLDLDQLAQIKTGEGQDGWAGANSSWSDFDMLRFGFSFDGGVLRGNDIALTRSGSSVQGKGHVNFRQKQLDWQLKFLFDGASAKPDAATDTASELSIQGSWTRPLIRSIRQINRAAGELLGDQHLNARKSRL
jgi:uncharacterized protein involved in outer membrane biogenesis